MTKAEEILASAGKGNPAPTTQVPPTTVVTTEQPPTTQVPTTLQPPTTIPTTEQPGGPYTTVAPPTTVQPAVEIEDTLLLESLKKRGLLGPDATLEDLRPKPKELTAKEKEELFKKEKNEAFKHALENELFTVEEYDQFVIDTARPSEEIAFEVFKKNFLESIKGTAQEGTFEEADLQNRFKERNLTPNEMEKIAKSELNERYPKFNDSDIVNKYKEYQEAIAAATTYKGVVEDVFATRIPEKLSFVINGVTVSYKPTAEALEAVKATYLEPTAFKGFGKGATADKIAEAVQISIAQSNLDELIKEIAESYHDQKVVELGLGRRGAIPERGDGADNTPPGTGGSVADRKLDENKKP